MPIRVALLALGALAVILFDGAWRPPVLAGTEVRYSGTVVSVDPQAGTLVLEEMTVRFDPKKGAAEHRRTLQFRVTLLTALTLSERLPDDEIKDLRHPFRDRVISLSDVRRGDFVTVEAVVDGTRRVVNSITVTFRGPSG
ncbi:MAG: hypothetical protein ACE5JD_04900 [Candidatus Methylomirabilia bacterium]